MKITIVGAGNIGLAMLSTIALLGQHEVTLYTEKEASRFSPLVLDDVENGVKKSVTGFKVSASKEEALADADMIFCTYPAFLRPAFVQEAAPFLKKGTMLGFLPGYGGIEYHCKELIEKGVEIFAFQRVPFVARCSVKPDEGAVAGILSRKTQLYVGTISHNPQVAGLVQGLLGIPTVNIRNYLAITLTPSNPLLHITGIYNVFGKAEPDAVYPKELYLYEEWTDETSEILFRYDAEVQEICRRLAPMDMSEVVSLPVYYESDTPHKMTKKLQSIEAFKAVKVPLKKTENGYGIDFDSRMFREDFPYGVCVLKAYALLTGVKTSVIDEMLVFYDRLTGIRYFNADGSFTEKIQQTGVPQLAGLDTVEKVRAFYAGN